MIRGQVDIALCHFPHHAVQFRVGVHNMQPTILALFLAYGRTTTSMCVAAIMLLVIGIWRAKSNVAPARGLDKVVALGNLCFAMPLAVFGAEHFAAAQGIMQIVPKFMPWPLFWTYFVGVGLVAAALSIATKVEVRWSGLLFGIMMFTFVAMMDLPGTFERHGDRISVALFLRELSFGGAGWILAGTAMGVQGAGKGLIRTGRVILGIAAIYYGVEHFLHPLGMPGVPLEKEMPSWIPARALIDYLTGVLLIAGGLCFLLKRKTRMAATYLGSWIVLMVVIVYGPVLIAGLADPSTDVQVEALNYFFDTLLFGGAILALAKAAASATTGEATGKEQYYIALGLRRVSS